MKERLNQRAAAALVVLGLIAGSLSGCGQAQIGEKQAFSPNVTEQEQTQQEPQQRLEQLKISGDYDLLTASPWNCAQLNSRSAATLLYDAPVSLQTDFSTQPALAEVSGSGTEWTLTVKEGITFSDGSQLTAKHIDDSLALALAEGSYYRARLENIASHKVLGDSVQVTLNQPDALFANLMTFPVAKWDGSRYIGTGRYRLASQGEESVLLEINPSYWGKQPSIRRIEMIPLSKKDVETYSLKLGKIDCLYIDGASADISNLSAGSYPVTANQLIFLGANASRGQTADAAVRQAISRAIDRDYLMRTSLTTSGKASDLPLHPDFFAMEGYTVPAQNIDEAKQMLTQAGALDEEETLELTLLYSTDGADRAQLANQLAAQLAQVGIQITLDGRSGEDYFSALESGSYDLYLGELLLGDDMDLSHLFTRGEHYGYGALPSQQLLSLYQTAYSTGEGWDAFSAQFVQEYPVVPLAFRSGSFCFSRQHTLKVTALRSDLFYNIDSWQS